MVKESETIAPYFWVQVSLISKSHNYAKSPQRTGVATHIIQFFVAFFLAYFCVKLPRFRIFLCQDPHIPRYFRANARPQKPRYRTNPDTFRVRPPSGDFGGTLEMIFRISYRSPGFVSIVAFYIGIYDYNRPTVVPGRHSPEGHSPTR